MESRDGIQSRLFQEEGQLCHGNRRRGGDVDQGGCREKMMGIRRTSTWCFILL